MREFSHFYKKKLSKLGIAHHVSACLYLTLICVICLVLIYTKTVHWAIRSINNSAELEVQHYNVYFVNNDLVLATKKIHRVF